jgi:hypothetical protein
MRRTACNVLKGLVTGSYAYLVNGITPLNFEQKLRHLVVGHIQNATQLVSKLTCEIKGCEEGGELDFQVGTHPLLKNQHDIPAFLEIQKEKFEELGALEVDTEFKMHPLTFIKVIMLCAGPYMKPQAEAYFKQLNTTEPYTFEKLQALVSTYESSMNVCVSVCGRTTVLQPENGRWEGDEAALLHTVLTLVKEVQRVAT